MEEKIKALLEEELPDIDFDSSEELVDDGILDSLSLSNILSLFSMEFDIDISFDEISEENFNSVKQMAAMVERLMK